MKQKNKQKIHPNIIWLGIVSCLNDVSSEMIIPILPLLITKVGGTGIALGLVGGLRDSFADMLKFFFGYLSDKKHKRKEFIFTGYLTAGVFRLLLIFARSWSIIFALVGLERIGKGIRTSPRDALISQSIPDRMGRGFGIHRSLNTLGAIFGSIFVFFLLWKLNYTITSIIIISSIIGLISLVPLLWVKDLPMPKNNVPFSFSLKKFSTAFKAFTAVASLFSLANISYMFFMLRVLDVSKNGFATPLLLYIMYNIFYTLSAVPIGIVSDAIGRWKIIVLGYTLFAIASLGFALGFDVATLAVSFMVYGVSAAIVKVGHNAFVSDLSKPELRATALGIFDTITGIVTLSGGLIAGVMWEKIGHHVIFYYAAALAFISVLFLLSLKKINLKLQ